MTPELTSALAAIRSISNRPHHTEPGYEHWFAEQVWIAAQKYCAAIAGPKCAESIMAATGVVCCEQNEQGGPGWVGWYEIIECHNPAQSTC